MIKTINFIIILIIFELSINILAYIDVVAELIQRDLNCHSSVPKICVKFNAIYEDAFIIFVFGLLPFYLLSYLYSKIKNSKLWIVVIVIFFTFIWVRFSYIVIGGYTIYLGHTWLYEEIQIFTIYQEHYFIAYALALNSMLLLAFLNIKIF